MKRATVIVALALALPMLAGSAGATPDLSLHHPPGAPNPGIALCLPACPAPDAVDAVAAVPAVPETAPAVSPVAPSAPAPAPAVADLSPLEKDAYGARLHAELCAARPVFCDVDQSGKYISQ